MHEATQPHKVIITRLGLEIQGHFEGLADEAGLRDGGWLTGLVFSLQSKGASERVDVGAEKEVGWTATATKGSAV